VAHITSSPYDNLRNDATLKQRILTLQNGNTQPFGRLRAFKVDGAVYAGRVVIPAREISGKENIMCSFIAAEHDAPYHSSCTTIRSCWKDHRSLSSIFI
jgi:hypothetical protein